jgi:hypothetical protein
VRSRNPLWDEHEEEYDPSGERILDQDRLTLTSSALDALPRAITTIPEDSILPLLLALAFTGVFTALTFKLLWAAVAFAFACVALNGIWLWPKRPEVEA